MSYSNGVSPSLPAFLKYSLLFLEAEVSDVLKLLFLHLIIGLVVSLSLAFL